MDQDSANNEQQQEQDQAPVLQLDDQNNDGGVDTPPLESEQAGSVDQLPAGSEGDQGGGDGGEIDLVLPGDELTPGGENEQKHVPISPKKLAKLRESRREAVSEVGDLKAELEQLKAQLAQGRPAAQQPAVKPAGARPQPASLAVPDRYDFETDEQYNQAHNQYMVDLMALNQSQTEAERQKANFTQQIDNSMSGHYERASTLLTANRISPERYQTNEAAVRAKIGDGVFEHIVDVIGEGSEKAAFYLGDIRNSQNLMSLTR